MALSTFVLLLLAASLGCVPSKPATLADKKLVHQSTLVPKDSQEPDHPALFDKTLERPSTVKWAETYQAALRAVHKPDGFIMLVFGARWSAPCQVLEREAFSDPEIVASLHKGIIVEADIDDPQVSKLSEKFGVQTIPHLEFLSPSGHSFGSIKGYLDVQAFKKSLKSVLKEHR